MRILVLQMTRMGDVLQTSPLIRVLKQRHPDAHITVMVRKMGKSIAEHNPDIDEVIIYDEDEMFLDLRADDSDRLLRAYERADAYVRQLAGGRFDIVYNCTHSLASAHLTKMAGLSHVVGAHLGDEWQFILRGRAVNYFFTSVHHREFNDLNLCDLFRLFLDDAPPCDGLVFEVADEDRRFAVDLLEKHNVAPNDFVACFQLGASDTLKRWPEASFAALGQALVQQRNARIFLLGVPNEASLGEAFERSAPGIAVPLYGKTNVPQLAALLKRANVLVTNDTGTMHIAAAVRCPLVLVSVGYVHFRETGPYGVGHCAVERRRETFGRSDIMRQAPDEDRAIVRPEHVLRAVDLALDPETTNRVPEIEDSDELKAVDMYVSRFAHDGCLQWYPVLRRPLKKADYVRIAYRFMWLEFLGQCRSTEAATDALRELLGCYGPPGEGNVAEWRDEHVNSMEDVMKTAQKGINATEGLLKHLKKGGSMSQARGLVRELMQLDEAIRVFSEVHSECKPLVAITRFERDNLEGADPLALAETTLKIYRDLETRAHLMKNKLQHVAAVCASTQV